MPRLLNEPEAAEFLNLSCSFLRQARVKGIGPVFIKAGRAVRYALTDLEVWLEGRKRTNTLYREEA